MSKKLTFTQKICLLSFCLSFFDYSGKRQIIRGGLNSFCHVFTGLTFLNLFLPYLFNLLLSKRENKEKNKLFLVVFTIFFSSTALIHTKQIASCFNFEKNLPVAHKRIRKNGSKKEMGWMFRGGGGGGEGGFCISFFSKIEV